jgi:hypothetical protein
MKPYTLTKKSSFYVTPLFLHYTTRMYFHISIGMFTYLYVNCPYLLENPVSRKTLACRRSFPTEIADDVGETPIWEQVTPGVGPLEMLPTLSPIFLPACPKIRSLKKKSATCRKT